MIVCADARYLPLPASCVQTVVTSPPYWGLRDYGHRDQIGLEPTPDAYVASLVQVFTEIWRVLRDDGTLWLNLGDTYARTGGTDRIVPPTALVGNTQRTILLRGDRTQTAPPGLKDKDLVGIPWRVAFALQASGWYLRADNIWAKPNPMPESVTDRPTRAHEYVFLLTKSPKYYYDHEASKEPAIGVARRRSDQFGGKKYNGKNELSIDRRKVGFNERWAGKHSAGSVFTGSVTRNRRSVWTIAAQPFAGAHFAVFPEALVEPCILAGSRPGDLVCDPFGGSGTVAVVSQLHQRRVMSIDQSLEYCGLAASRVQHSACVLGEIDWP